MAKNIDSPLKMILTGTNGSMSVDCEFHTCSTCTVLIVACAPFRCVILSSCLASFFTLTCCIRLPTVLLLLLLLSNLFDAITHA